MKEVSIRIDKTGKVHFDFNGFQGDACFVERKMIQEMLQKYGVGVEVEEEHKKEEAYEETTEGLTLKW